MARDLHAFDGDLRLAEREPRKYGVGICRRERQAVRNLHGWCAQASDFGEGVENLLEREIFSAQQVALTHFTLFGNQQMARGTLFHANKIQPGLDVAGHLAIQEVDDAFSRWSRL